MISFLVSLLISVPAYAAIPFGNGFVVGNGGDGYLVDGRILLRDLLESGAKSEPEFGLVFTTRHEERIRDHRWGVPFNRNLLARKLTDLNVFYPFLGDAVLETLLQFNLTPIQTKLFPLREGETIVDLPPENLVQIANRLGSMIRIHEPSWRRMPESHRIALLIHEGLYGLAQLDCANVPPHRARVCTPNVRKVREITGRVFLLQTHDSAVRLNREIDPLFRLPFYRGQAPLDWNTEVSNTLRLASADFSWTEIFGSLRQPRLPSLAVRTLCNRFERARAFQEDGALDFIVHVRQPTPVFFSYTSSFGPQQAVGWSSRGRRSAVMRGLNKDNCERRLTLEAVRLQNPSLRFF